MQQAGDSATGNNLEKALNRIHREDIVEQCIGSLDRVTDLEEQIIAKTQIESTAAEKRRNVSYDEEDIMKDSESFEDVSQVEVTKVTTVLSPMATSYETEEVKYGPEEKEIHPRKKFGLQIILLPLLSDCEQCSQLIFAKGLSVFLQFRFWFLLKNEVRVYFRLRQVLYLVNFLMVYKKIFISTIFTYFLKRILQVVH